MFHRILVPLDGSERAEWALPVAARLAQASAGTVVLLRVVSPVTGFLWYPPIDHEVVQRTIDADVEEATSSVESLAHIGSLQDVHTEAVVIVG